MSNTLEFAPQTTKASATQPETNSQPEPQTEGASEATVDPKEDHSKKPSWVKVDTDLKAAIGSWQALTEQMADKIPPDEEQLREVKRLLSELKDKLKDFT